MAIYPVEDPDKTVYVISSRQLYLPGVYASRRAANYAFRFSNSELQKLADEGEIITFQMLQTLRKRLNEDKTD